MEKYYCFAGVELLIDIPDDKMYAEDRGLAPFRVNTVSDPHRFQFRIVDTLAEPEGEFLSLQPGFRVYRDGDREIRYIGSVAESWEHAYLRAAHQNREHRIQLRASQFPGRVSTSTVLTALAAEHLVTEAGGVVFHSACVCHDGSAILFTAPSGTGKSTQAELWRRLRGAEIMNGDRAVIRRMDGGVYACGLPFAGSSEFRENYALPLAAVVYLQQAPVTSIRRLRGFEAFSRIWEGCSINTWNPEDMARTSEIVMEAAGTVPVYCLPCTPDESAVIALEDMLREVRS